MNNNLKDKTIHGMFWEFFQKISGQLISFVVSVILARLLTPDDYGIVALAGMFIVLLNIFAEGGLGAALIQKKEVDELDYNTLFISQLSLTSILYFIIFFLAPFLADVYHKDQLTSLVRAMALIMPLGALKSVQCTIICKTMRFKFFFYSNILSLVVSAIVGLYMAFYGYGPWALVGQNMSSTIVSTIVIFFLLGWKPKFIFSFERFKVLIKEGLKFMGTSLIGTFFAQLNGYIMGWKYTASDLAYCNRGGGIPNLIINNIDYSIQGVLFPALSQIQNDTDAIKRALSRAMRTSSYIIMPLLFGLASISDKLVIIIYTDKWAPAIPFMQIFCFCLAIGVLCNTNLQALKATGNIGLVFRLEWLKKPIMLVLILITMQISPLAIQVGMLFFNIFVFFVNSYPNKKIINYSYKEQMIDIAPNISSALIMSVFIYFIGRFNINIYLCTIIQIIFGVSFYILSSYLTKNESFYYILNYVKDIKKSKNS